MGFVAGAAGIASRSFCEAGGVCAGNATVLLGDTYLGPRRFNQVMQGKTEYFCLSRCSTGWAFPGVGPFVCRRTALGLRGGRVPRTPDFGIGRVSNHVPGGVRGLMLGLG